MAKREAVIERNCKDISFAGLPVETWRPSNYFCVECGVKGRLWMRDDGMTICTGCRSCYDMQIKWLPVTNYIGKRVALLEKPS